MSTPPAVPPTPAIKAAGPPCSLPPKGEASRWFAEQVQPHETHLRNYLQSAFPSVRDVDDVIQESFLRIWKTKAVQPIRSVKAFLFHAARNIAIDLVRRHQNSPVEAVDDIGVLPAIEEKAGVAEQVSMDEKLRLLADAVTRLPPRCREVFMLCKFRGLSHQEAAAQLGINPRTVDEQIVRGYKKLNEELRRLGVTSHFE